MEPKTTEWRPGPSVCRCCLTEGCYKDIATEYFWMGKREVYEEMLSETLNVSISYSQSGGPNSNSRLICEPCISRLRDATEFKRQVQECEKTFMQHLDPSSSQEADIQAVALTSFEADVKIERVKLEEKLSDDDFGDRDFHDDDDDDDDLDNQPLMTLATKIPKKESVDLLDLLDNTKATVKRKSSSKVKGTAAKKTKTVKREAKAGASKSAPKVEKKKKDGPSMTRQNAVILLTYATVYPFRLPEATVMCVYCCKNYVDPAQFRLHMKEEHVSFNVKNAFVHCTPEDYLKVDCTYMTCRVCSIAFEKIDDMARHLNNAHDCKLNFDFDLGIHPFILSQEKLLCGVCESNLPCLRRLSRHVSSHYQNYTCDLCGKCYATAAALKQHLTFTHIDNKTICRKCRTTFSSLEAKKEHVASSPNCWQYLCPLCSKRFVTWTSKEEHLVNEHGLSKKRHTCSECGEQFNHRNSYRSHFKIMHTKENFSCTYCGRKFGEKRYLDEHTVTHTGLKTYHCQVCSKSFPRKSNLSQHMWLHSDVKRFECKVCDKKFNQRVSYKSHMKNHHPDVTEN